MRGERPAMHQTLTGYLGKVAARNIQSPAQGTAQVALTLTNEGCSTITEVKRPLLLRNAGVMRRRACRERPESRIKQAFQSVHGGLWPICDKRDNLSNICLRAGTGHEPTDFHSCFRSLERVQQKWNPVLRPNAL